MRKASLLFLVLASLTLLGAGCDNGFSFEGSAEKAAEFAADKIIAPGVGLLEKTQNKTIDSLAPEAERRNKDLNEEQKRFLEDWLKANNLNEYGDPRDTVYAGGNPLFDMLTGEFKDRFEHIFARYPELKEHISSLSEE